MKKLRKVLALVLAMVMVLGMSTAVFAQDVGGTQAASGKAQITIKNAAKGEKYKVVKLFNATVTGTDGGSIAYTGTIPDALSTYFTKDSAGNISATAAAKFGDEMSDGLKSALKTWAGSADDGTVSDGSVLNFNNLDYGYYVVLTTQGASNITVTSTNPTALIFDKNNTTPVVPDDGKTVNDQNVAIGQTLTYTLKFETANYEGSGENAKQILSYIITDTLPSFLTDVTVTSVTIGGKPYTVTTGEGENAVTGAPQFDSDKKITIPWVGGTDGTTSLYNNGAEVVVTYTAKVADSAAIAGDGNTNAFTMTYTTKDGVKTPDQNTDSVTVKTYAFAIKKVDENANPLAGATFQLPFYVKKTKASDGAYIYAFETLPTEFAEGDSANYYTNTVTTPESGELVIKGVEAGEYSLTETKAPDGYNKLTAPVSVTAQATSEKTTTVTKYIDEDGNVVDEKTDTEVTYSNTNFAADPVFVVNMTGTTLPSTGGMGTTLFYVFGAILVIGAGIVLVTRRRMAK